MASSNLLRERIHESGYRLAWIAEQLGISRYSLSNKIDDITEFKKSEIAMLCMIVYISNVDFAKFFFLQFR